MTPELDGLTREQMEPELTAFINETPILLSLLYDVDLLPEQCKHGSLRRDHMLLIAAHFKRALEAPREAGQEYRCFHCKRVFTGVLAEEHFGTTSEALTRCVDMVSKGHFGGHHGPSPSAAWQEDEFRFGTIEPDDGKWSA